MITFGGIIFWFIVITLLLWEIGTLYNDEFGWAFGPLVALGILFVFTKGVPNIEWKYILVWPLASGLWLPIYWYLSLCRKARTIKKAISKIPGEKELYRLGIHEIAFKDSDDNIKIKHPGFDELLINSIMVPISAPLFIFESWVEAFVDYIKKSMDKIRDNISESINV